MPVSTFNRHWAAVILEALTRCGIRYVYTAPGSRFTPSTLTAAKNPTFIHHTHFNEHGLGYLALDLVKVSRQSVIMIVTFGTTMTNLYPTLIEVDLTGEKLILLTADRPSELIDYDVNQTIRQVGMFASHPSRTLSLPRPIQDILASWPVSTINNALAAPHSGAVHINCPFMELLYGDMDETEVAWQQRLDDWWQGDKPQLREMCRLESGR